MYKTRRQARYNALKKAHFTISEAKELSAVSFSVPYMKPLLIERVKEYDKFIAEGNRATMWIGYLTQTYIANGWTRQQRGGQYVPDVWTMLRAFEHTYKAKFPDYESPWRKKRKNWKDFVAKLEHTYQKQLEKRHYGR